MARRDLDRLISIVGNQPLYVTPDVAWTVFDVIAERKIASPAALAQAAEPGVRSANKAYVLMGDVAVVPVHGELVNRGSQLHAESGLTSYDGLQGALRQAERDLSVKSIVMDIDSPGGEAAGAIETANVVRAVSAKKPIVGFVNSLGASAAYAIAAGATEIVSTPSATLGSIGVVWLHLDRSKMLAAAGLKPTLLHAGAAKVDGNSLEALSPAARVRIQGLIDNAYDLLVGSIGQHRSALGVDGAKATEAGVFMGQGAVDAGLADRVGDQTVALGRARALASALRPRSGPMISAVGGGFDVKRACAEAVAIERERIGSILFSGQAKNREKLAAHLALLSELPAAEALAVLAIAPESKPPLRRDLGASVPKPMLGPGAPESDPMSEYESGARSAMQTLAAAGRLPRQRPAPVR